MTRRVTSAQDSGVALRFGFGSRALISIDKQVNLGRAMMMIARSVATFGCALAISVISSEAGAQPADSATRAGELEKAWSCEPTIVNRRYYEFNSPNCSSSRMPNAEMIRLLTVLVDTYGDPRTQSAEDAFRGEWTRRAQERGRNAQRIADAPKLARQRELRDGKAKLSSYEDAFLLHDPRNLFDIMDSPLLKPDSGIYGGAVLIEGDQGQNVVRVRSLESGGEYRYALLVIGAKTKNFAPSRMRVNGTIHVTGRYIRNAKYRTVIGAERVAPVLEAMYIGDAELKFPK